ncbi:GNAT family N-acetyltransferase [Streptomyces sp. NPDC087532]|uniref:GNAT family N-acetyltransferase n=1 Tax=Streptomyces sp. NPDC087532 TaxID=3365795 RepID=UPI0038041E76
MDWKGQPEHRWPGRHVIAVRNGRAIGNIDFYAHPDALALEISLLFVYPEFQGRGVATMMMNAVYEAYPDAWINHGRRTPDGAHWWNRYREPAPGRNIHNRPPQEWAAFFAASRVGADRQRNADWNSEYGLLGNRKAEYRYGQRLEEEFQRYDSVYVSRPDIPALDPARQDLYAGQLVYLPPGLHQYVHRPDRPAADRAHALLSHIRHGNLPRNTDFTGFWNTDPRTAFDDVIQQELFLDSSSPRSATHVIYQGLPHNSDEEPQYKSTAEYVEYTDPADIGINLTGMRWRSSTRQDMVHEALFDRPVAAAIAPEHPRAATARYRALYDETGELRTAGAVTTAAVETPAARIRALTQRLLEDSADRLRSIGEQQDVRPSPARPPKPGPAQEPRQPSPPPAPPTGPRYG